ncbi:MAG TPA: YtxH domain-containing protein [Chryseolinea sp.]
MDSKKALLGIVAGIAAGAVLGVLFAPEKGSRTRKGITRKGEDLAEALNDKIDEKLDNLVDAIAGKIKKAKPRSDGEQAKAEMAV